MCHKIFDDKEKSMLDYKNKPYVKRDKEKKDEE